MSERSEELYVYQNIIRDMQEGILVLNMKGRIIAVNPAGWELLQMDEKMPGTFGSFLIDQRNDEFSQAILDSIYEKTMSHNALVDYYSGDTKRKLFVNTSYLNRDGKNIGVIAVMNDVTELMGLKDAVVAMNKIKKLNQQLEVRNEFIRDVFGRYLSDTIVDSILEQKKVPLVGGEKKEVTMIFSDLRGFSAIAETMDARELIDMLNHYLEQMIHVISEWNGTILEFIGDAIVAVFGAPLPSKKAEEDAVSCAVWMQKVMEQVNSFNVRNGYPILQMGVGVHRGEVIIGNIGSQKKLKYDIIGKHVNLTSRIESYSVGGEILISHSVLEHIHKPIKITQEKEIWPKGMKERVKIYQISGIGVDMLDTVPDEIKPLLLPIACEVRLIAEKTVTEEKLNIHIIAVSRKKIVFETEYLFKEYDNLEFFCEGQRCYAKVLCQEENKVHAQVTYGDFSCLVNQ